MKRIIVATTLLLVTAATAQAQYRPAYPAAASTLAAIAGPRLDRIPPGFRAVMEDAINDIQHGSTHPRAHDASCMARQRKLADDIEAMAPGGGPVDVSRNPAVMELRTRCMPEHYYSDD
jgi:hypothetical protein